MSSAVKRQEVPAVRLSYSVEEGAKLIGIGRTLAWSLVWSGALPSVRFAGRVLIRRRQFELWLDSQPGGSASSCAGQLLPSVKRSHQ
jgi:excisionase family DNA binding protein